MNRSQNIKFSMGPAIMTLPLSILSFLGACYSIYSLPKLPGIWALLFIAASCYIVSFWRTRNELKTIPLKHSFYWTKNHTVCSLCLVLLALVCISLSLIMGTFGVAVSGCGLIIALLIFISSHQLPRKYGCTNEIVMTVVVAYVVFTVFIVKTALGRHFDIVAFAVKLLQPFYRNINIFFHSENTSAL